MRGLTKFHLINLIINVLNVVLDVLGGLAVELLLPSQGLPQALLRRQNLLILGRHCRRISSVAVATELAYVWCPRRLAAGPVVRLEHFLGWQFADLFVVDGRVEWAVGGVGEGLRH